MCRLNSRRVVFTVLATLLLAVGCYESKFTLGPKSQAVFDPVYLGDWQVVSQGTWADGRIVIRNWEDSMYYVEWSKRNDPPLRMSGFVINVKGASFAHLRQLREDPSSPEKYLLFRVGISRNRLSIRPLNATFFEGKSIYSSQRLRNIVEENLENDQMYDKDNSLSAIRLTGFARGPSASTTEGQSAKRR